MPDISELMRTHNTAELQLLQAFGAADMWGGAPVDDATVVYWWLSRDQVYWGDDPASAEAVEDEDGEYNEQYTRVWATETHTLVYVLDCTGGGGFLTVFDNSRYIGIKPLVDVLVKNNQKQNKE